MSATIANTVLTSGGLNVTYRAAGDRAVLIEYGPHSPVDLNVNFLVHAVARHVNSHPVRGLLEVVPGLRSLLVYYEPSVIGQSEVVSAVEECHQQMPEPSSLVLPSRRVRLPIAFDDSASREAVNWYCVSTRPDAPNVVDGNNIDYIVACNGFSDREHFYATVMETEWWNAFTGFYAGLASLLPLDPRCEVVAPKYNPARNWTPEGAVAFGGPCLVVHPIESPGAYQMFGRTLPISSLMPGPRTHRIDPTLLHPCDRISFFRTTEQELLELRRQVFEGRYDYDIEPGEFSVAEHTASTRADEIATEVARRRATRDAALETVRIP
ncbi:allophanate hydrolase subunit 1 [Prauserella sediminis]|uniref:Allophanate hydrolase subunit 1 n=1 Tax=Prauserella sediminis TaxID=577680 RepID=A0A839XR67_9PSEU|nr:carboxyltransferase domain-containing protein [Prauserella sediminis]MBB3664479.1 allophanate hydrolase subunit 1 [Prauserella sediminis]